MGKSNGRQSIFVTGAASGIGAETARFFAGKGWFVGLYDIDEAGLAERVSEIGEENCISGVLDVRKRENWKTAIDVFSDATGGKMSVLFNNAGIGHHGWFEDIAPEQADNIIDINVKGVINGVYAALPLLKATKSARIVNVASVAGFIASPQFAVYAASKFAVRGLTEALDVELSPKGIKVTSLAPWFIDTPILDMGQSANANHKLSDDLHEKETKVYPVAIAAEAAWEAAHGKKQHYGAGKLSNQMRFMARYFPGLIRRRLSKLVSAEQ